MKGVSKDLKSCAIEVDLVSNQETESGSTGPRKKSLSS
jgi:hypothetical protein